MINALTINIGEKLGGAFKFTQSEQLGPLFTRIVGIMIVIATILFLLYFIWGGIRWLTSGGDKAAVAEARNRLSAAFIGLLIVLAGWLVYSLVRYMFGIQVAGPVEPTRPTGPAADCYTVCNETSCHGYDSFCYKDCRCICDSAGKMWYYDNPWCDADNNQYVCRGGQRLLDNHGQVSGEVISTCPGNQ